MMNYLWEVLAELTVGHFGGRSDSVAWSKLIRFMGTSSGLQHLKPLKRLETLSFESTKVTANDIKRLQVSDLPSLIKVRPE